jgi:hypothetical protein
MAVRTEMQSMINYIRSYGSAASTDVFNGVTYWTDDQLQDVLDRFSKHATVALNPYTAKNWGLISPRHAWFDDNAIVVDGSDTPYSGSFEYNSSFGEVAFTVAPDSSVPLYVSGLQCNLWEALADLWAQKAMQRYDYVNFKAGNNKMDMETEKRTCEQQRDYYRARTIRKFPRVTSRFVR